MLKSRNRAFFSAGTKLSGLNLNAGKAVVRVPNNQKSASIRRMRCQIWLLLARPSCDVAGQWSPAGPEANRHRAGPKFRVQQSAPWPIHWMQWSCSEPDRLWSPYLGRLATVSMTEGNSFVRRAKTSTVTPIFFSFSFSKRNISGRFWRFLKKNLGTVFLLQRFGVVNPWTCSWDTYKSLQKNCSFRPQSPKKTNTVTPNYFLISGIVITQKNRFWKKSAIF